MKLPIHPFHPRLLDDWRSYNRTRFMHDLAAGLTVGVVALPLAMAFAIASGLKPETGIITAIVAGFLTSALGGSSVQIGGPAGAFIVVVFSILERYGLTNLLISTFLAGVLLFTLGWLRLGVLIRYIPVSIVIGFTNGIAVLIALSQLKDFLGLRIEKLPADFFSQIKLIATHLYTTNLATLALALACLAILFLWPKLFQPHTQAESRTLRTAARIPGPIIVLSLATLAASWLNLPVETIGSRFGELPRGLPDVHLPPFDWTSAKQLLIPTLTLGLLGAIESLLCARVADNLATNTKRHDSNQELMAQGIANMVSPLLAGMPATGTIARTVTNIRAGATSPIAGMVHAITLLLILLIAAPLAAKVPLAALAAILLFVAYNMGEWQAFAKLGQYKLTYRTVLLGTFALTVMVDLMVAVEVGLVLACVFFIYRVAALTRIEPIALSEADTALGIRAHTLYGMLFFGAVTKIEALQDTIDSDERARVIVLDASQLINLDTTGLEALESLHSALKSAGRQLLISGLHEQPQSLLMRSGFAATLGVEQLVASREEALMRARALVAQP